VAYRFYEQHPDETLIVVTADHETGGMALGNRYGEFELQLLANQKCSSDKLSARFSALHQEQGNALAWEQVKDVLAELTGIYGAVEVNEKEDAALQEAYRNMMCKKEGIKTLYEDINALAGKALHILNDKAGIGWATGGHTATAVPIFAIGVGAERFTGWHDNSEIAPLIYQATRSK
jgi:alkaline phosphatase